MLGIVKLRLTVANSVISSPRMQGHRHSFQRIKTSDLHPKGWSRLRYRLFGKGLAEGGDEDHGWEGGGCGLRPGRESPVALELKEFVWPGLIGLILVMPYRASSYPA